jgi:hypothetical protein
VSTCNLSALPEAEAAKAYVSSSVQEIIKTFYHYMTINLVEHAWLFGFLMKIFHLIV